VKTWLRFSRGRKNKGHGLGREANGYALRVLALIGVWKEGGLLTSSIPLIAIGRKKRDSNESVSRAPERGRTVGQP